MIPRQRVSGVGNDMLLGNDGNDTLKGNAGQVLAITPTIPCPGIVFPVPGPAMTRLGMAVEAAISRWTPSMSSDQLMLVVPVLESVCASPSSGRVISIHRT